MLAYYLRHTFGTTIKIDKIIWLNLAINEMDKVFFPLSIFLIVSLLKVSLLPKMD